MFAWLFGSNKSDPAPTQPKKPKKEVPKPDHNKWVQQALLQFLMSKEWRITLLNFVDNNCMVFDNEEENKFEYTSIHNKFKSLVAGLFDSVMDDIGIDSKTLVAEIAKGLESKSKKVFEQLLYVEDFLMFKGMMLKRNIELEKEALSVLNSQNGEGQNAKKNQLHAQNGAKNNRSDNEIMKQILKISKLEDEERKRREEKLREQESRMIEQEQLQMQRALEQSKNMNLKEKEKQKEREKQNQLQNERVAKQKVDKQNKQKEKEKKLQFLKEKREKIQNQKKASEKRLLKQQQGMRQNLNKRQEGNSKEQHLPPLQQIHPNHQKLTHNPPSNPIKEEIQERKQKLIQYRQLLRKKKSEERAVEMKLELPVQNTNNLLALFAAGGVVDGAGVGSVKNEEDKIPKDEIERRRELMKRIKNKIVEDY